MEDWYKISRADILNNNGYQFVAQFDHSYSK